MCYFGRHESLSVTLIFCRCLSCSQMFVCERKVESGRENVLWLLCGGGRVGGRAIN